MEIIGSMEMCDCRGEG